MRITLFLSVAVYLVSVSCGFASDTGKKRTLANNSTPKGTAEVKLDHEIWGQTIYGDGYVYGPTNRQSGMTVVDIDTDGDNDVLFPSSLGAPEWMVNQGSPGAFYPGGSRQLEVTDVPDNMRFDLGFEFGDFNGDTLPDFVAVVSETEPTFVKKVILLRNLGPRERPKFIYQGTVYTSPQTGALSGMFLTVGDLDSDKDLDLYVAESFLTTSDRPHRLFFVENTGTSTTPQLASPVELQEVSQLLPDRIEVSKLAKSAELQRIPVESFQVPQGSAKGVSFSYNLGDIGFADWDLDGDSDFLFYSREDGLFWIPNTGSPTSPAWSSTLGNGGNPLYDHEEADGLSFAEVSFALRENPNRALPGAEWSDEVYLSVNRRLKIIRYYTATGYRVDSQNAVAFDFGQGPSAFWDFDQDGDLDLFKTNDNAAQRGPLLLVRNRGTVYAPAWDDTFLPLNAVSLHKGNTENGYREDQYTIAPYLTPGVPGLYVQRQDATLDLFLANSPTTASGVPTFDSFPNEFPNVVNPEHSDIAPAGIAVADFDGDGLQEIITVYQHYDDGVLNGELVVVDMVEFEGEIFYVNYVIPEFFTDASGFPLDPSYIESMAAGDVDKDGRPDILVTTSNDLDYFECETSVYLNKRFEFQNDILFYEFNFGGRLEAVYNTDHFYARMPALADIDADSDLDLFMSHRYPDGDITNLFSYQRFYRNGSDTGRRYTRFRMTAETEKALKIPLVTGPQGQVTFVEPEYDLVQNTSGGTLKPRAVYRAGDYAPSVDILDTTDLISRFGTDKEIRSFVDIFPTVGADESKAIIVVGDTADGDLYPTFAEIAAFAYRVILGEGLPKSSIRLYAATNFDIDGDGANDVTGPPTLASLQASVTGWGASPEKLLVYLVDHGQRDRFRLNATEFLEAATYDSWLDQIQVGNGGPRVTTVIDTCESGSFIDNINGPRRTNITGANVGPTEGVALFDKNQYISFSLSFWAWLYYGNTYGASFRYAKTAIESLNPLQKPQIDDDGDGIANEPNDGTVADGERPGGDFEVQGPSVFISEVAPNQPITSNSATLWLAGVASAFPVDNAKAVIVPPNFQRPSVNNDDEQPVTNLPVVFFTFNATRNRWEGQYNGFTEGGLYQIQYYVTTGGQVYASPLTGFVDRINAPDAWESDNSAANARWLAINTIAGHNFHQNNDEDWIRFSAPAGPASIALLRPRHNCQPVVEIYKADDLEANPSAPPFRTEFSEDRGEDLVFENTFATSGQYLLRIRNAEGGRFGEGTSYQVIVAVDTGGGIIPTTLVISVLDENEARLDGVRVQFNNGNIGTTDVDGIVQTIVPEYGSYTVAATKDGFVRATQNVSVNNLIETTVLRLAVDDGTEPEPKEGGGCAACSGAKRPAGLAGDLVLVALMLVALFAARKVARVR